MVIVVPSSYALILALVVSIFSVSLFGVFTVIKCLYLVFPFLTYVSLSAFSKITSQATRFLSSISVNPFFLRKFFPFNTRAINSVDIIRFGNSFRIELSKEEIIESNMFTENPTIIQNAIIQDYTGYN